MARRTLDSEELRNLGLVGQTDSAARTGRALFRRSSADGAVAAAQWESRSTEDGREYFVNARTGVSQWERPAKPAAADAPVAMVVAEGGTSVQSRIAEWERRWTEDGTEYFVNLRSGVSQWERPDGWSGRAATLPAWMQKNSQGAALAAPAAMHRLLQPQPPLPYRHNMCYDQQQYCPQQQQYRHFRPQLSAAQMPSPPPMRRRAKMASSSMADEDDDAYDPYAQHYEEDMARHLHVVRRREWRAASVAGEAYLRRGGPLDNAEEAGYLAAGVLPYCTRVLRGRSGRAICVLLGAEVRGGAAHNVPALNLLGGKREMVDERAAVTAWRELSEESGGLMADAGGDAERRAFMRGGAESSILWYPPGRYALFTHRIRFCGDAATDAAMLAIDERYAAMPVDARPPHAGMASLHWVALDTLLAAITTGAPPGAAPLTDARGAPLPPPGPMLREMFRHGAMRPVFDALSAGVQIKASNLRVLVDPGRAAVARHEVDALQSVVLGGVTGDDADCNGVYNLNPAHTANCFPVFTHATDATQHLFCADTGEWYVGPTSSMVAGKNEGWIASTSPSPSPLGFQWKVYDGTKFVPDPAVTLATPTWITGSPPDDWLLRRWERKWDLDSGLSFYENSFSGERSLDKPKGYDMREVAAANAVARNAAATAAAGAAAGGYAATATSNSLHIRVGGEVYNSLCRREWDVAAGSASASQKRKAELPPGVHSWKEYKQQQKQKKFFSKNQWGRSRR